MKTKQHLALAVLIMAGFIVARWALNATPDATRAQENVKAEKIESTNVTVGRLNKLFGKASKLTSKQREAAFKKYENKYVQWKGTLKEAFYSEDQLFAIFTHQTTPVWLLGWGDVKVSVSFSDSEKDKLLNAGQGSTITYRGQLTDHAIFYDQPWRLVNGQVVSEK